MRKPLTEAEESALAIIQLWLDSLRDWFGFITRNEDEPLPIPKDAPPWVHTAASRLEKTLFAPARAALDKPELTPYRAGYALGLMRWGLERLDARPPKEVRQSLKKIRLSRNARKEVNRRCEAFLVDVQVLVKKKNTLRLAFEPELLRAAKLEKRWADEPELHRGLSHGLQGFGPNTTGDRSNDATPVYLVLVMWWRFVAKFQSVTVLHTWLQLHLGKRRAGDISRTARLCNRIKLKLRDRGAPRQKPAQGK